MSFSQHRFTFVGNLTRDPEIVLTKTGKTMGKISICVNETFKTRTGFQNKTHFFPVVVFDEYILKRLGKHQKGDLVFSEGDIVQGQYKDDTGKTRYSTSFIARTLMGPGLKNRVLKELENIYDEEMKPKNTPPAKPRLPDKTGPTKPVTEDEITEIFNDIDL